MDVLVSVIVPVYKVEKYIVRCVDALINQTLQNIEIILVDDGSPDECPVICDNYAKKDTRIRVIHKENGGLGYARNSGISIAKGKYIAFVDSDDWIEMDMYRIMYEEAKRNDADIVMCGYKATDGVKVFKECYHQQTNKAKLLSSLLILHESWSVWNKMCKRSLYDSDIVYPTLAMGEDMVLTTQMVLNAQRIAVVNKALYNYFYNCKK